MTTSLEALVMGCRDGDETAVREVARRAATLALRTATLALGDAHAAADVSQETAVRVLRGIHDLRDPARFDGWVYRIAVSEVRRAHNRRRRQPTVSLDAPEAQTLVGASGILDVDASFARGALREALADIPLRQRTAIALRYVCDLSDTQIAAAMGCRPGTARSLLSRGLARLADHPALKGLVTAESLPSTLIEETCT
jgi:RNA polymerase sigma factor (sigma-70 family)